MMSKYMESYGKQAFAVNQRHPTEASEYAISKSGALNSVTETEIIIMSIYSGRLTRL